MSGFAFEALAAQTGKRGHGPGRQSRKSALISANRKPVLDRQVRDREVGSGARIGPGSPIPWMGAEDARDANFGYLGFPVEKQSQTVIP